MSALANQPAFPQALIPAGRPTAEAEMIVAGRGMSLRQFYAGLAMQGLLANSSLADSLRTTDAKAVLDRLAVKSTEYADALIAQLEEAK